MDENEKIDNIKYEILEQVKGTLGYMNLCKTEIDVYDVRRTMAIKNLVESYDILNNMQEEV